MGDSCSQVLSELMSVATSSYSRLDLISLPLLVVGSGQRRLGGARNLWSERSLSPLAEDVDPPIGPSDPSWVSKMKKKVRIRTKKD